MHERAGRGPETRCPRAAGAGPSPDGTPSRARVHALTVHSLPRGHCPFASLGQEARDPGQTRPGRVRQGRRQLGLCVASPGLPVVTSVDSARCTEQRERPSASLCLSFPHKETTGTSPARTSRMASPAPLGACPSLWEVGAPWRQQRKERASTPLNRRLSGGLSLLRSRGRELLQPLCREKGDLAAGTQAQGPGVPGLVRTGATRIRAEPSSLPVQLRSIRKDSARPGLACAMGRGAGLLPGALAGPQGGLHLLQELRPASRGRRPLRLPSLAAGLGEPPLVLLPQG